MARMRATATFGFVAVLALFVAVKSANAGAVIYNTGLESTATIAMGINDAGHNNIDDPSGFAHTVNGGTVAGAFGVAIKLPGDGFRPAGWYDGTSPGCLCEGWGLSATVSAFSHSMYASVDNGGISNVTVDSFASDAGAGVGSMATSSVHMTDTPGIKLVQAYAPSTVVPGVLFEDKVTITNMTGGTIDDLRYVRLMDWDIPYGEFHEYVTILGTATTSFLELSHDDGFESPDPLAVTDAILGGTTNTDFVDSGPADHGAYFKFNFGSLADGESFSFSIFYGAAYSEREALAAVSAQGIELFSLGQEDGDPTGGTPATYIFGFKGVGGVAFSAAPLPGASLMGLGLLGLLGVGRRLRRKRI